MHQSNRVPIDKDALRLYENHRPRDEIRKTDVGDEAPDMHRNGERSRILDRSLGPGKTVIRVERAYLRHLNPVGTSTSPLGLYRI